MYGYTVHVKRFLVQAAVTAFVTVGFSFDDEPAANSKDELSVAPPGHTTSGAVRTGECNHEMPGLPYPAFRRVNAEPGGGRFSSTVPSPEDLQNGSVLHLLRRQVVIFSAKGIYFSHAAPDVSCDS
jgi:hypothetical protein